MKRGLLPSNIPAYRHYRGETHIDPEQLAYGGRLWGSERRGYVRMPDGVYRTVRLGIPDTFFTIPAVGVVNKKRVRGYVFVDTDLDEFVFKGGD
jgi:hypothetical protein